LAVRLGFDFAPPTGKEWGKVSKDEIRDFTSVHQPEENLSGRFTNIQTASILVSFEQMGEGDKFARCDPISSKHGTNQAGQLGNRDRLDVCVFLVLLINLS
jgi:hypothetical protein